MKNGLLVLSHNVEDGEALTTRALLIRAGLNVKTITFQETLEVKTSYGLTVIADTFGDLIDSSDYDFLVIPGGRYVSQIVNNDTKIKGLARKFHDDNKLIAAICAGPRFLGQAKILDGYKFTAYPGSETDMPNGYYQPQLKSLRDRNIITARSAGSVVEFAYEIVSYFLGEDEANSLLKNILY